MNIRVIYIFPFFSWFRTGDIFIKELSKKVGSNGQAIFLTEDSKFDLEYYEKLIIKQPQFSNISYIFKSEFFGKIESSTIDAIFQIFGVHMYEDLGLIMQELGRILKPGKKIVICDPLEIDHFIFNHYRKIYPSLHTGTTPENISSIFKHGRFTNIHIETLHGLCIASAEKMTEDPKIVNVEPLTRIEDLKKKEEKHFYTL